jgi:hypothetical protein
MKVDADVQEMFVPGAFDCVTHPLDMTRLRELLATAMDSRPNRPDPSRFGLVRHASRAVH